MADLLNYATSINLVSALIVGIVIASSYAGMIRGASGSARHLFFLIMEGVLTVASLMAAWKLTDIFSPKLQLWLMSQKIEVPNESLGLLKQMYYTLITGVRDFSMLRFGLVFMILYIAIKQMAYWVWTYVSLPFQAGGRSAAAGRRWAASGLIGGVIGTVIGSARALFAVAFLFVYVTLLPQAPLTQYIQSSEMYKAGATKVIQPFTGDFIAKKLPVFTRAVEEEFTNILRRKYEVIDQRIPDNIAEAAREIVAAAESDEEKARMLYDWVGTRIEYDWEKVKLYEEQNIWKEQTPEDTFATREGVCIDYSRLYAVMARSVGLDVKVVTGLGYDGRGSYGPHAWNEVYISENKRWIPLDTTWVSSGKNWFNPPDFYQTHVKERA
jgi:uncharacterized membrane protein required for colicin V production